MKKENSSGAIPEIESLNRSYNDIKHKVRGDISDEEAIEQAAAFHRRLDRASTLANSVGGDLMLYGYDTHEDARDARDLLEKARDNLVQRHNPTDASKTQVITRYFKIARSRDHMTVHDGESRWEGLYRYLIKSGEKLLEKELTGSEPVTTDDLGRP